MASLDLLAANAAFDAIQGILVSLSSSTSTSITQQTQEKPLAPGMTMFIGVAEYAYNNSQFFSNKTIVQNIYSFSVYFSVTEGQALAKLTDLELYSDQKAALIQISERANNDLANLDPLADTYDTQYTKLNGVIDNLNTRVSLIDAKIAAIGKS